MCVCVCVRVFVCVRERERVNTCACESMCVREREGRFGSDFRVFYSLRDTYSDCIQRKQEAKILLV